MNISDFLTSEEMLAEVAADEALWDAQFAATTDEQFAALVASVEAEINADNTRPMNLFSNDL